MERIEHKLKKQLKESDSVSYPDFEQMWSSIQQDKLKVSSGEPVVTPPKKRKRLALVAGLCFALIVTPVYATLTYDWSSLLSHRTGIQSALEQGLGQTIEQSVTKNGATFTVHTAFVDDNRTFLLYSLKPDSTADGNTVSFDLIGLKDKKGNFIEGNYVHNWNAELGVFQGYFETDWVAKDQTTEVEFSLENIRFIGDGKQSINYDPNDPNRQVFQIQKDGIDSVALQSFEQSGEQVLLQSAITFTDPDMQDRAWPRLEASNDKNEPIREVENPLFGTPGDSGEYLNQQVFKSDSLRAEGTQFQLAYERTLEMIEGTWNVNIVLSKKQLENGSFKEVLDLPLDDVPRGMKIAEMVVTPTQIRLILTHEQEHNFVSYMDYQLDVGGTILNGGKWFVPGQVNKTELRFEVTGFNSASLANQPMTLIAKHRVDGLAGDDNPIHLSEISATPQSLTTSIAGYPITWTYYMKDNHLYVESSSSNSAFGGVSQTYYLEDQRRNYGEPVIIGMLGSVNNKRLDVYENFDKTDLDIYIWRYTTNDRNAELRIPLKLGK